MASAGLMAPGWAHAQADSVAPWGVGGMIASGLIAVIALVLLAWLRRRMIRESVRADHFVAESARLEAFLAAAPEPYCGWSASGAAAVSPQFAVLLGADSIARLEDVEAALDPGDAAALHGSFARLRSDGVGFTLIVSTIPDRETGDTRLLQLTGRRGESHDGDECFDVLWAVDVTERETTAAQETEELASASESLAEREAFEDELRAMLDALPLPVWLRDGDLSLRWANKAYADAVDGTVGQVLEEQRQIASGAIDQGGKALAIKAQTAGEAQTERHHVVIGGERRLVEVTELPIAAAGDGDGRLPAIIGFAVDLTGLEEAESVLRRHIDAHAEVLEQLKSAIAIFGPDKRLKFFNQAYVTLWGFDERWLETQPGLSEMLEDLRERRRLPEHANFPAFKTSQLALFTSLIEPQEDLMHLPDEKTLRAVITPHPFGGLLFVLEDVTSSLDLERRYNTLMAVQQESLDNLAEAIAVFGSDGRLQLSNPAFLSLWRLSQEDIAGQPHVAELIDKTKQFFDPDEDWPARRDEMVARALERRAGNGRFERADESILQYSTVPLPDGGVLNSYLDVTDSARVEQALRSINEALETADQLKTEFIANVSYQLRTPLNAIMGFAEILDNKYFGPLNDRQLEYTKSIIDASHRLLALINDILDLATIEAGYLSLEYKQVVV